KTRACKEVGIETDTLRLPDTISAKQLKKTIHKFNQDDSSDGILVQLPLPSHLSSHDVIEAIDYHKDVDGFHPMNVGRMAVGQPSLHSCMSAGISVLFNDYIIATIEKDAEVVGANDIVCRPSHIFLSIEAHAINEMITISHKYTKDLTAH